MSKPTRKKLEPPKSADYVAGAALQYNYPVQERYSKALVSLVKQMTRQTQREIALNFHKPGAKEYFALDESVSSSNRILINALRKKFTTLFAQKAKSLSEHMLAQTEKASAASVRASLKDISGGLSLGTRTLSGNMQEVIKASIAENVSLIKSIPEQYFTDIEGAVMRSITTGNGLADLVPFFKSHESITIRRARLIASDQTKKAYSNITATRLKELDIKKYRWIHSSAAQESRPLHVQLNGSIQSLDDPPIIQYAKGKQPQIRGKPGDLINCTCIMQPIVDFSGE